MYQTAKHLAILFATVLMMSSTAHAQHKGLSFQAVLQDPEGNYPTASGLSVTLQILDPVNNCVLREEVHSGASITDGYLNLVIGSSIATVPAASNPSPILSIKEVMDNSKAINGFNCTYTPSAHHGRKLRLKVSVPKSSGGVDLVEADFNMRAVAYAVNSETLNGKTQSDFVNVNDTKNVTQENIESIFERFTKLDAILNNSNASGTALGVNITGNAATATTATNIAGGVNSLLPSQAGNGGKYLKTDGTNVSWEATAASGGLTQVGINLPVSVFTNGADITANGQVSATFANQSAKTFFAGPTSGSGVPSFRVLTTADVDSFATDVDARADARIANAKDAANGIAGLDANSKIPLALLPNDVAFSSSIQTGTLKLTGPSSNEIQIAAPTSGLTSYNIALPTAVGTTGQVLKIDSVSGSDLSLKWETVTSSGGTLTSVGLNLPSTIFDMTNNPLTADGSIAATLKTQAAHTVFAGPSSGGPTVPGFRALTASDIPNLGWSQMTGVLSSEQIASSTPSFVSNGLVMTGATNVAEPVVLSPCIGVVKSAASAFSCAPLSSSDLATDIIKTGHIENGAVTDAKISGTISSGKLPIASGSTDGIINQIAQSLKGVKTFLDNVVFSGSIAVNSTITATGNITTSADLASTNVTASGVVSADRIKVANSTATCDGTTEGSLRYNSTSKKMEYCNGTSWTQVSQGTQVSLSIGAPSTSLVKSGPVTFDVTYGGAATISLDAGDITLGGTGTTGCSVTGVSGAGSTRTVTVDSCTGTGTVAISLTSGTATSTSGESAPLAGPSTSYNVDNTGPTAPTGVTLGSVPANLTNSPTITYTAASDVGGSTVANHQVQIIKTSDSSVVKAWANHTSGSDVGSLTLSGNTQYSVIVRAVDGLGNIGSEGAVVSWTSMTVDPCLDSPTPGTVCTGGAIFLGSLSPGATSGSGTDKYMTTPGGCGEIPAGQIGGGSGAKAWPNADFTPTCSGMDALVKTWNDGTTNYSDIPELTNYTTTQGTGYGASNTDEYYGSTNTTNIAAITTAALGGYHAAARYCDKLVYGGYDNWYLPNRYELNLFYTNKSNIPGLDTSVGTYYWSSTEYSSANVWHQQFSDGSQSVATVTKTSYKKFRCVRRF